MIVTRTPLRISFFGGGTDLPEVYSEIGGGVFSTSINKYVYILLNQKLESQGITAKYSKLENVDSPQLLMHPIMREILGYFEINDVDISVSADVPAGTGMGSSSSFTVGFINACTSYLGISISSLQIAEMACNIEMVRLGEPIGKQDAYAAGVGGLNYYEFLPSGKVRVMASNFDSLATRELQDSIRLVSVGEPRSASKLLAQQVVKLDLNRKYLGLYEQMKNQALWASNLELLNLSEFGEEINRGWELKKQINPQTTNISVDTIYNKGLNSGAIGGKLLGAGKSGYVMFIVPPAESIRFQKKMEIYKPRHILLDNAGTSVLLKESEA